MRQAGSERIRTYAHRQHVPGLGMKAAVNTAVPNPFDRRQTGEFRLNQVTDREVLDAHFCVVRCDAGTGQEAGCDGGGCLGRCRCSFHVADIVSGNTIKAVGMPPGSVKDIRHIGCIQQPRCPRAAIVGIVD